MIDQKIRHDLEDPRGSERIALHPFFFTLHTHSLQAGMHDAGPAASSLSWWAAVQSRAAGRCRHGHGPR
jgi:hypothetical protein